MNMREVNLKIILTLPEMLKSAGLEETEHRQFSVPIGWGPADIASLTAKVSPLKVLISQRGIYKTCLRILFVWTKELRNRHGVL